MLSTPTIMMASTQERLSKFGKDMSNKRKPQLNKLTDALKNIVDEEARLYYFRGTQIVLLQEGVVHGDTHNHHDQVYRFLRKVINPAMIINITHSLL